MAMMKCEICGKECKTEQGLAGHMRWLHGRPGRRQLQLFPTRRLITDAELVELFKKRDETGHQEHMQLLDRIQRLGKEQDDIKKQLKDILEQLE